MATRQSCWNTSKRQNMSQPVITNTNTSFLRLIRIIVVVRFLSLCPKNGMFFLRRAHYSVQHQRNQVMLTPQEPGPWLYMQAHGHAWCHRTMQNKLSNVTAGDAGARDLISCRYICRYVSQLNCTLAWNIVISISLSLSVGLWGLMSH